MVHEFQVSVADGVSVGPEQQVQPSLDQSFFFPLPVQGSGSGLAPPTPGSSHNVVSRRVLVGHGRPGSRLWGLHPLACWDFLSDQEMDISQDTLFGLFAPVIIVVP